MCMTLLKWLKTNDHNLWDSGTIARLRKVSLIQTLEELDMLESENQIVHCVEDHQGVELRGYRLVR